VIGATVPAVATAHGGQPTLAAREANTRVAKGEDQSGQVLQKFYEHWKQTYKQKAQKTDATRVAEAKAALAIGYGDKDSAASVTVSLDKLPKTGKNGTNATWQSGNPSVLSNEG
jgi:hypothetical protein